MDRNDEVSSPMIVAGRLEAVRTALDMSKAQFADTIGIDRSSYTKMEQGKKPLLPREASRIWTLWGVDLNYIYLGRIDGLPENLSRAITDHLTKRH